MISRGENKKQRKKKRVARCVARSGLATRFLSFAHDQQEEATAKVCGEVEWARIEGDRAADRRTNGRTGGTRDRGARAPDAYRQKIKEQQGQGFAGIRLSRVSA